VQVAVEAAALHQLAKRLVDTLNRPSVELDGELLPIAPLPAHVGEERPRQRDRRLSLLGRALVLGLRRPNSPLEVDVPVRRVLLEAGVENVDLARAGP
jgi:hypothetical protein